MSISNSCTEFSEGRHLHEAGQEWVLSRQPSQKNREKEMVWETATGNPGIEEPLQKWNWIYFICIWTMSGPEEVFADNDTDVITFGDKGYPMVTGRLNRTIPNARTGQLAHI